jgi:hypothetical protein
MGQKRTGVKFLRRSAFAFPFVARRPFHLAARGLPCKIRRSPLFSENLDKCKKLDLSSSGFAGHKGRRAEGRSAGNSAFA